MQITREILLKNNWEEINPISDFYRYQKTINNFHYTLTNLNDTFEFNCFNWELHIDSPHYCTVGLLEVETMEDIENITKIYNKYENN